MMKILSHEEELAAPIGAKEINEMKRKLSKLFHKVGNQIYNLQKTGPSSKLSAYKKLSLLIYPSWSALVSPDISESLVEKIKKTIPKLEAKYQRLLKPIQPNAKHRKNKKSSTIPEIFQSFKQKASDDIAPAPPLSASTPLPVSLKPIPQMEQLETDNFETLYQDLIDSVELDDIVGSDPSYLAMLDALSVNDLATDEPNNSPNPLSSPPQQANTMPSDDSIPQIAEVLEEEFVLQGKTTESQDGKENHSRTPILNAHQRDPEKSKTNNSPASNLGSFGSFPAPKKTFYNEIIEMVEHKSSLRHCGPSNDGNGIVFRDSHSFDEQDSNYHVTFSGNHQAFEIKSKHLDSVTKLTQAVVTKNTTITINSNRRSDEDYASMRLDFITLMRLSCTDDGIKVNTDNLDYLYLLSNDPRSMDLILNTLSKNPSDIRLHQYLFRMKADGYTITNIITSYFLTQDMLKEAHTLPAKARQ